MDGDGLGPVGLGHHHRPAGDAVGGQDRHLRLVDDRDGEIGAEGAVVRDGERSARDVVRVELAAAGPLGQVADAPGHAAKRDFLGPVDDGDDQTLVGQVDRDPEVHLGVDEQRVVDDRRVEQGEVTQRLHRRPGDEGEVGQRETLLGLEALAPGLAHALDALEVHLVGDERVGRGRLRPHHVLRRAAAHVGEGHDLVAGGPEGRHGDRRGRRRARHGWGRCGLDHRCGGWGRGSRGRAAGAGGGAAARRGRPPAAHRPG